MKIFISWSGPKSNAVAAKLRDWLPLVLHYAEPWMSDRDIQAGGRWSSELATQLQDTAFGIIVLTAANKDSRWLHFEAGALSKSIEIARIIPYLIDFDLSGLDQPLSQFQAKKATYDSTWDIINTLNVISQRRITDSRLKSLFDLAWPDYQKALETAPSDHEAAITPKPTDEILEELVISVKGLERGLSNLEDLVQRRTSEDGADWKSDIDVRLDKIDANLSETERLMESGQGEASVITQRADEALQSLKDIYISVELRESEKVRSRALIARAQKLANLGK